MQRINRRWFMKQWVWRIGWSMMLLLCGCSSSMKVYKIGIDPSWFPLDLMNKEPYVLAFAVELLQKIGKEKHCVFERVSVSWDNLLEGLQKKECQGALSSLEPLVFTREKYDFSDNFLDTGPVLIAKESMMVSENDTFYEKEIAVFSMNDEQTLVQKYPDVLPRMYDSVSKAMIDLIMGNIDALLLDYVQAFTYVTDLYQGQLKIVSAPLNASGLKLITLSKEEVRLVHVFNEGLRMLKSNGEFDRLLQKWKLGPY